MGAASLASMIPGVLGKYEVLAFVGFVGWVAGATIRLREGRLRLAGPARARRRSACSKAGKLSHRSQFASAAVTT